MVEQQELVMQGDGSEGVRRIQLWTITTATGREVHVLTKTSLFDIVDAIDKAQEYLRLDDDGTTIIKAERVMVDPIEVAPTSNTEEAPE